MTPSGPPSMLGLKLAPLSRTEALCFICTPDRPFLLSRVAGNFTIHNCSIEEAEIQVRDGLAMDMYRIKVPAKYDLKTLESELANSLQDILKGRKNLEKEIFRWEKNHHVIQDFVEPEFQKVTGDHAILTIGTSNKIGLLHKLSWALSLAGVTIDRALFVATGENQGQDIFWISHREGSPITADHQALILRLLKLIVAEGKDPIEQDFKKELNMIYRQQLRRRGGGFTTAQLYANAHINLIQRLFERIAGELAIYDSPLLIGVFGGVGSGAIGFTSDIDVIFLHDGPWREEYEHFQRIFIKRLELITGLEVDETFLQHHINIHYLSKMDQSQIVSFDDLFGYIIHMRDMLVSGTGLFMPQFAHFPWAFSLRLIGNKEALHIFNVRTRRLPKTKRRTYSTIKSYVLGELGELIKPRYQAYLGGRYNKREIAFLDDNPLRELLRKRAYGQFIDMITPYEAVKYVFRRGVFPLLQITHGNPRFTDMGLLRRRYGHLRPALDFMLKAYNVRKTLFLTGWWDLDYFLHIMKCSNARTFCTRYLKHQQEIEVFVQSLTN
jgi:hypothetical protein